MMLWDGMMERGGAGKEVRRILGKEDILWQRAPVEVVA